MRIPEVFLEAFVGLPIEWSLRSHSWVLLIPAPDRPQPRSTRKSVLSVDLPG